MTGGGSLVRQSPALCGALSFLRAGEALHYCPGWGWVLLPGGTQFFAGFLLRQIRRFAGIASGLLMSDCFLEQDEG